MTGWNGKRKFKVTLLEKSIFEMLKYVDYMCKSDNDVCSLTRVCVFKPSFP